MASTKPGPSRDGDVDLSLLDESHEEDLKTSIEELDSRFLHPISAYANNLSTRHNSQGGAPTSQPKKSGAMPTLRDAGISEGQAVDTDSATDRARRKRSISEILEGGESESQAKRVAVSLPDYRQLYNEEIENASSGRRWDHSDSHEWSSSQLGTSTWAIEQKKLLFDAVAKYGRDALPEIAAAVGKSQPEVHQYLLLLEDGLIEYKANYRSSNLMQPHEFPAAVELSEDLRKILEGEADRFEAKQRLWEEQKEKEKWGDYWLLNSDMATRVQRRYDKEAEENEQANHENSGPENEPRDDSPSDSENGSSEHSNEDDSGNEVESEGDVLDHIPTARFLHLPNMLKMSENLFMNSNQKESNWSHYSDSRPSIRHTAFTDFHALAVSVTKRIVSVVLFQAMTRLRTGGEASRIEDRERVVYAADVLTALDILGLKHNSFDYWVNTPRRCGLNCDIKRARNKLNFEMHLPTGPVSLEDAETALRNPGQGRLRSDNRASGPRSRGEHAESQDDVDMSGIDLSKVQKERADKEVTSDDAQSTEEDHDEAEMKTIEAELELEREEDDALERYDAIARAQEESRLWAIVGKGRGPNSGGDDDDGKEDILKLKASGRSRPENVIDWRDWTEYRAPWEGRTNICSGK
jgi:RNA polymerase I-specific transcription initiation factor RRN5